MTAPTAHALGIDVGGTKIAAGWVSLPQGQILARRTLPTNPQRGGEAVRRDVQALLESLFAEAESAHARIAAVGLGLCELVDPQGRILSANCLDWRQEPLGAIVAGRAPFTVEADVRAAARAEATLGAGRDFQQFLFVTVGTGIACSLVLDGEPYLGARGATGTMASTPLSLPCEQCGHVNSLTLEQWAAGPALVDRLNQRRPQRAASGSDVLAAAANGDADALRVVREGGAALAATLGLLVNVLDPEAVVVGGGLGLSDGPFWAGFVETTRRHIWSTVHRDLPIRRAATGTDAGWLGAALHAWRRTPP